MTSEWLPGHAQRAKGFLHGKERPGGVLEVIDARAPKTSTYPFMPDWLKEMSLLVLTHADLAEPAVTGEWVAHFRRQGKKAYPVDARQGKGVASLDREMEEISAIGGKRGWWIVGLPNLGKSSLANRLLRRASAATGGKPGITRGEQRLRHGKLELVDTPGLLWPRAGRNPVLHLLKAVEGGDEEREEAARFLLDFIVEFCPQRLGTRYGVDPFNSDLLEAIGTRRGCIGLGGKIDRSRTVTTVLDDFRAGKLGPLSLERPMDPNDQA